MKEQLYKEQNGEYSKIFPLNYIQNLIDSESGNTLTSILQSFNNIYVPYQESIQDTRNIIPISLRRKGLWITYNNGDEYITEYYKGKVSDIQEYWSEDYNWEIVPNLKYVQDNASKLPDGIITPDKLSPALQELIKQNNTITNLPDDEDLEEINSTIRLKDRNYNIELASGKGYKILRKNWTKVGDKTINLLTQDMISESNTVYEIRYDFNLNGQTITIPSGCVLLFEGGSISNGTLRGINTQIDSLITNIFKDVNIVGSYKTGRFPVEWWGASEELEDNSVYFNKAIKDLSAIDNGGTLILSGHYNITDTIYLYPSVSLEGIRRRSPLFNGDGYEYTGSSIRANFTDHNKWILDAAISNDGTKYEYDELNPKFNKEVVWYPNRKSGITIKNIDFININYKTDYIFGGIRISQMFNSVIENVSVFYTLYGIIQEYGWENLYSNIIIKPFYCGVYLGATTTTTTINTIEIKGVGSPVALPTNLGKFLNPDTLFPPYTELSKVGIIMDGSGSDNTAVAVYSGIFQYLDAIVTGTRNNAIFNDSYIEGRFKTLVWTSNGDVTLNNHFAPFVYASSYELGTDTGCIKTYNIENCKCWYNGNYTSDLKQRYYIHSTKGVLSYYDKIEVQDNKFTTLERTPSKGTDFDNITDVYVQDNNTINTVIPYNPTVRIGYNRENSTTWEEVVKRGYNNINIYQLSRISFKETGTIEDKKYTFAYDTSNLLVSSVRFDTTVKIKNSEITSTIPITTDTGVLLDSYFDVQGGINKFNMPSIINVIPLFTINGDTIIDLYTNNNNYKLLKNLVANPETSYIYTIRVHVGDTLTEFSNKKEDFVIRQSITFVQNSSYRICTLKRGESTYFKIFAASRIYNDLEFTGSVYSGLSYGVNSDYNSNSLVLKYKGSNIGTPEEEYDVILTCTRTVNSFIESKDELNIEQIELPESGVVNIPSHRVGIISNITSSNVPKGLLFFDTTKNKPYFSSNDGVNPIGNWLDALGNAYNVNYTGGESSRPTNPKVGFAYYDVILKRPMWWDESTNKWVYSTGYSIDLPVRGNTNSRPTLAESDFGYQYYDSTLRRVIVWNGTTWINVDGTSLD